MLGLLLVGTLLTVGLLLRFPPYLAAVGRVHTRLVEDRRYFVAVLVSLVVVPVGIAGLPV